MNERTWLPPGTLLPIAIVVGSAMVFFLPYLAARWFAPPQVESEQMYQGTELEPRPAPEFSLTDHRGQRVALGDFRGKLVVLTFLDSQCTDVCPLVGLALRDVHQKLTEEEPQLRNEVAFLAINVSHDALRTEDVADFTARNKLDDLSTWYFLTGSIEELEPTWQAYGVSPSPHGEAAHTVATYILDRQGQLRWLSTEALPAPLGDMLLARIRMER